MEWLSWAVPLITGVMLTLVGVCYRGLVTRIGHIDDCLHRIEEKRSDGDGRLHERLDEIGQRLARMEGERSAR